MSQIGRDAAISPWVCLHHFTLPGWFTEMGEGGFVDDRARSYFWARHVSFCAETFGDLVFGWKPINEPSAYSGIYAQGGRPAPARDWRRVFDVLGAMLLAQRDAWRELRGGGKPVATIHDLSPIVPLAETARRATSRPTRLTGDAVRWDMCRGARGSASCCTACTTSFPIVRC